jgi:hypothetical protein
MRPSVLTSLVASGILASLATFAPACSSNGLEDTDDSAIFGGQASGTEDDNVVLLVRDGKPLCTATLIAPGVLVTAQHCVGQAQSGQMVHAFEPAEITVRIGSKPGAKAAAVATKIYTPRLASAQSSPDAATPPPASGGAGDRASTEDARALTSMDVAAILVQSLDPSFDHIRPRKIRDRAIAEADAVTVVGWNATGSDVRLAGLERQKRSDVDVLADPTEQTSVSAPSDESITTTNKAREFVTESVACQGDDGAPAFDSTGNLAGVVAAVVGPCAAGSLSVFTDLGSQRSFLQGVLADVAKLACSADAKCGRAGTICDTSTFTCGEGCRLGSVTCGAGASCGSPSDTAGVAGVCRAGTTSANADGGVDPIDPEDEDAGPPFASEDGGSTSPGGPTAGCHDSTCGGSTSAPKICDAKTQACVAGCRVGASPSMCGPGSSCKAGAADPTAGTCVASNVSPPPTPTLAPPGRPTEEAEGQAGSGLSPSDDDGDGGAKKKKKKNAAQNGAGCAVTPGLTQAAARGNLVWLGIGAIVAFGRRRSQKKA